MPTLQQPTEQSHCSREIYGTFHLSGDEFAIEMADLQEVVNAPAKMQKMPLAPAYLLGLFNLRGRILPVVDLRVLLQASQPEADQTIARSMVVLRRGPACLGLLFDRVGEILRVEQEEITPIEQRNVPDHAPQMPVQAVICRDAGQRIIQVLDLAALLTIRNLPSLTKQTGTQETNDRLTSRMRDLYREKLIGFTVGDCNLALELKCIAAIIDSVGQNPSPWKSEICETFVTFRDQMVPVVRMSSLLKIPNTEACHRILICHIGEHYVGFEVNQISNIIPYAREKVLPIPVLDDFRSAIFHGCFTDRDEQQFIVLNEVRILSDQELVELCHSHNLARQKEASATKNLTPSARVSVLTFRMGKLYALNLRDVLEVLVSPRDLARAPNMPKAVLGVLNLRGTPVSVIDPRQLFDLGDRGDSIAPKLLVFEHASRKVAMQVDSVESILSLSTGDEDDLPDIFFREERPRLDNTFERGVQIGSKGDREVVIILSANEIVEKLTSSLTA
jgi:purine-binding chemotaxis protein CheW